MSQSVPKHKFMTPLDEAARPDLTRRSKLISLEEAGSIIASKKTVSLAGSHSSDSAMSLIRAAIKAGAKNMTLIPPVTTSMAADLPIAAGMLSKLYVSYIGFELWGMAPAFREAAEKRTLEIIEADEPFILLGTQAAAGGRPFNAVQYLYEATSQPKLNPELRKIVDPYSGREVYLIPPLRSDVFIMHAQVCDEYGNAQCWGGSGQERDKAKAADMVIIQADEIVPVEVTQKDPGKNTIPGLWVDHVVHVPYGAHPAFSSFQYAPDEEHIKLYMKMIREGRAEEYIDTYIRRPKDHMEYLDLVGGLRRMMELKKMLVSHA